MTKKFQHLSNDECERLLALLNIFEYIFDGILGECNKKPEYLELKDDIKPVC